jgi:type IX secretion system PorP/SprF family membrane protein
MKKVIILILFNLIGLIGFSQSNIRLNNYWENTYYINPASIYSEYQFTASVAGRDQWIGFPGNPISGFLTATVRIYPKRNTQIGQLGLKAFYDELGYTKRVNISPSYSYSVKLKKNLLMNLGLAVSFQQTTYDMSKSTVGTIGDPIIYMNNNTYWESNADFGVEFVGKSILFGAASQNLFSLFNKENWVQTNTNFLYAMYRKKSQNLLYFQYGICAIQNVNLSQMEFNVSSFLSPNNHPDLVQLGVSYRTSKEFGVSFGMDLGKFGKKMGSSARLAFRYDYNFGSVRYSSFGTPEILLSMKLGLLPDCKCRELFK